MIETVPIQDVRYKTSDGTHWDTEKQAILHEIECAIGENPIYLSDDFGDSYYDVYSKELMLHFIQHNSDLVKYILRIREPKYISRIEYREFPNDVITIVEYFANNCNSYDEAMQYARGTAVTLKNEYDYIPVDVSVEEIQCPK